MTTSKRGRAINGDLFSLRHESLTLEAPFTSFIDVAFRGTTHQVLAARDTSGFNYANTTGEFTVQGLPGHVIETIDTVETQATHRYQAIVESPVGALSTHSYDTVDGLLSLVGALRPTETELGLIVRPDDDIEFTSAPRVALTLATGIVEVAPLTAEVIDQLPDWQGTSVKGGELYAGRFSDDSAYLTLVTPTCRVLAMLGADSDEDATTDVLAGLSADWHT